ncbi:ABC transporter substrate-binding protein, partial [Aduncisulcus paluster]
MECSAVRVDKNRYVVKFLRVVICSIALVAGIAGACMAGTKMVTDMRGKLVEIPASPKRVITLDDGFIAGVMTVLGVQDRIIALGSHCPVKIFKYSYPTVDGEEYTYMN